MVCLRPLVVWADVRPECALGRWTVINDVPAVGCKSIILLFCRSGHVCRRAIWLALLWRDAAIGFCQVVVVGRMCWMKGDLCLFAFVAACDS